MPAINPSIGFQSKNVTHIISYDLLKGTPPEEYQKLRNKIRTSWPHSRPLLSFFTINSQSSCEDIKKILFPLIPSGGKLYVVNINNGGIDTIRINNTDLELKPISSEKFQSTGNIAMPKAYPKRLI